MNHFDDNRTDMPLYDDLIRALNGASFRQDKKLIDYFRIEKGYTGQIVHMRPDDFIYWANRDASPWPSESEPQALEYYMEKPKSSKYAQAMEQGNVFPIPMLRFRPEDEDGDVDIEHEGRHRMAAAALLGVETVPVLVVYPSYASDFPDLVGIWDVLDIDDIGFVTTEEQKDWFGPYGQHRVRFASDDDLYSDITEMFRAAPTPPTDKDIRLLAKRVGTDPEKIRGGIYQIMHQFYHEGEYNETIQWKIVDIDNEQLRRGIEVEMEHTSNPKMSKRIALDHLAEMKDYYTRLDIMERTGFVPLAVIPIIMMAFVAATVYVVWKRTVGKHGE